MRSIKLGRVFIHTVEVEGNAGDKGRDGRKKNNTNMGNKTRAYMIYIQVYIIYSTTNLSCFMSSAL